MQKSNLTERFKLEQIPWNDEAAFDVVCEGYTKGIFQLESPLGKKWCKLIKPRSIEEMSHLVSLLRPGCLDSGETDRYLRIRNEEEEPQYATEGLSAVLEDTYSICVFQEQLMDICRVAAGFDLVQADMVRNAVGKKIRAEIELHNCDNYDIEDEDTRCST